MDKVVLQAADLDGYLTPADQEAPGTLTASTAVTARKVPAASSS